MAKYRVTKFFTGGISKGLQIEEETSVLFKEGEEVKNPVGGSPYKIIKVEKISNSFQNGCSKAQLEIKNAMSLAEAAKEVKRTHTSVDLPDVVVAWDNQSQKVVTLPKDKIQNTNTKTVQVQGTPVKLAVDQSPRFGIIFRIWDIPSIPKSQLPKEGFDSEIRAISEASKIIDQFYT